MRDLPDPLEQVKAHPPEDGTTNRTYFPNAHRAVFERR
jgi:hypothetical protein